MVYKCNKNEKILYHVSNSIIDSPDMVHSKLFNEFGAGFYLFSSFSIAKQWAYRNNKKYINFLSIPVEDYNKLKVYKLKNCSIEWFNFVRNNIDGICLDEYKDYDIIEGNSINKRARLSTNLYEQLNENPFMTKKVLSWERKHYLTQFKSYELYPQICIKNATTLSKFKFVNVVEIEGTKQDKAEVLKVKKYKYGGDCIYYLIIDKYSKLISYACLKNGVNKKNMSDLDSVIASIHNLKTIKYLLDRNSEFYLKSVSELKYLMNIELNGDMDAWIYQANI